MLRHHLIFRNEKSTKAILKVSSVECMFVHATEVKKKHLCSTCETVNTVQTEASLVWIMNEWLKTLSRSRVLPELSTVSEIQ